MEQSDGSIGLVIGKENRERNPAETPPRQTYCDNHSCHWAGSYRGMRFTRKHVYPVHSVLAGCLLLRGRAEAIKPRSDLDFLQASLRQVRNELCLRQSTGDSTGPQIDVAAGVLGEFHIEGNIS